MGGGGGATPRFWKPTTLPTNCWPEAPRGEGGGGGGGGGGIGRGVQGGMDRWMERKHSGGRIPRTQAMKPKLRAHDSDRFTVLGQAATGV